MAAERPVETYVRGFRDRVDAMRQPGQEILDEPGVIGLIGRSATTLDGRVLVTDDRAYDVLAGRLHDLAARVVYVFDQAEACHRLMAEAAGRRSTACTAMVCEHLDAIPELSLPPGLSARSVRVGPEAEGAGVPLLDAAAAALRSDPEMAPTTDLDGFLDYLRSIPNTRFLAAVDDDGAVRATAATAGWGSTTGVFFVNTDAGWRGRGVGTAMTAAALRAGATAGAERACLDASALGLSLYLRLGFAPAGAITQFVTLDQ